MLEVIRVLLPGTFLLVEGIRDIRTRQISMISVGIFAGIGLVLRMTFDFESWYHSIAGAGIGCFLLLLAKVTEEKIGYGDGWIILVMGIYLGFRYNLLLLTVSLFLSALASVVLLMLRKVNRKSTMPFVAFVFAGYCIMLAGVI